MAKELTKTEIKKIINDEFDKKFNQIFVDSLIKELKNNNSPARKELVEMMKKAMISVHKFMWMRREAWQNEIK
jgi:hypothetical protein